MCACWCETIIFWPLESGAEIIKNGPAKTRSIALASKSDQEVADTLADSLRKIGRVSNLARLGSRMTTTPLARSVDFQVQLVRGGRQSKIELATVPTLVDGDEIDVTIRNKHARAVDLTILAIDRDYAIDVLFPRPGESNRVEADEKPFKLPPLTVSAPMAGQEALLFIITEVKELSDRADFSFLAQPALARTRGGGGALSNNDLIQALESIGFEAEKTRSITVKTATTDSSAMQFFWFNSIPKPGVSSGPP